ncbi:P2Y purinoceptor 14-like [Thunnus albacares]|uniref:P2Y purinoceptor 14-like n=1 Tax=Thunnus albacares TaxID=8236 RepID=UPI001CF6D47F|nr:P2Y purinoceptor 14-like [Thunnus albacares]
MSFKQFPNTLHIIVSLLLGPPETRMEVTSSLNMSLVTNLTHAKGPTHCEQVDTSGHVYFALAYSLVFLVGLLLNGFTMKVYFCSGQQGVFSIMLVYLKNLAVSDFLLCLCLPFYIANFTSSSITIRLVHCNFASSIFYLNMYASILFMGYIAAGRYLKIIHPSGNHILQTVQAARIISMVTWVVLLAIMTSYITLLLLTQPPLTVVPDSCDALQSAQVIVFYKIIHICSAVTFLFIFISLVFFYYSASRTVWLAEQKQLSSSSCKKLMKSRKKMLVLVSVFCICFMPYHLGLIPYALLKRQCSSRRVLYYLIEVTILLSVLNVCLDPLIYFISCKAFRTKLNLKRVFSRTKQTPSTDTRSNEGQLSTININ